MLWCARALYLSVTTTINKRKEETHGNGGVAQVAHVVACILVPRPSYKREDKKTWGRRKECVVRSAFLE